MIREILHLCEVALIPAKPHPFTEVVNEVECSPFGDHDLVRTQRVGNILFCVHQDRNTIDFSRKSDDSFSGMYKSNRLRATRIREKLNRALCHPSTVCTAFKWTRALVNVR